ncbi:MAG TPA: hypothetical protein VN578_02440 [Candidatus Binatia bacterium]|jgi:hypothetical protein|nr:hypothetical protein [Candidatus Binatia bacterium]
MNATGQRLRLFASLAVAAWLGWGCAHRSAGTSPRQLFREIHIGMPRSQVDVILGVPEVPQTSPSEEAWYLPPPRIGFSESPYAPGTIGIRFTADGKVAAKRFNPQYRD